MFKPSRYRYATTVGEDEFEMAAVDRDASAELPEAAATEHATASASAAAAADDDDAPDPTHTLDTV